MDASELQGVIVELMDHVAGATDHDFCEDIACVLCSETAGSDPFSFLTGLGEALGRLAHDAKEGTDEHLFGAATLLERLGTASAWQKDGIYASTEARGPLRMDPATAQRTFIFLKALALELAIGKGHARIET